jgi:hypothetical protein
MQSMLVRQMLVRQTTVGLSFMFYRAKVMALAHSPRFLNLFQADLTLVHKTIIVGAIRKAVTSSRFDPRPTFLNLYQAGPIAFGSELYCSPVPADGVE